MRISTLPTTATGTDHNRPPIDPDLPQTIDHQHQSCMSLERGNLLFEGRCLAVWLFQSLGRADDCHISPKHSTSLCRLQLCPLSSGQYAGLYLGCVSRTTSRIVQDWLPARVPNGITTNLKHRRYDQQYSRN